MRRRKYLLLLLLSVFLLFGLVYVYNKPNQLQANVTAKEGRRVTYQDIINKYQSGQVVRVGIIGNSVGMGFYADNAATYLWTDVNDTRVRSWANQLRDYLKLKNPLSDVINKSQSGFDTGEQITADAVGQLAALNPKPDIVFVPLQINDATSNLETWQSWTRTLLNNIISKGMIPVLVKENDINYNYGGRVHFNEIIAAVEPMAAEFNIGVLDTYTPFHSRFVQNGGYMESGLMNDNLHPNQAGQDLIYQQYVNWFNAANIQASADTLITVTQNAQCSADTLITIAGTPATLDLAVNAPINIPVSIGMDILPTIVQADLTIAIPLDIPVTVNLDIDSTLAYATIPLTIQIPIDMQVQINVSVNQNVPAYHQTSEYYYREVPNQYTFVEIMNPYTAKEIANPYTWKGDEEMYSYILGERKPVQVVWARKDGKPFTITNAVYSFESTLDGPMSIADKTTLINLEPANVGTKYCKIEAELTPQDPNLPVESHIAEIQVVVKAPKIA